MKTTVMMAGDINLLGVDDPAVPFRRIKPVLAAADVVLANLECCLYDPPEPREMMDDAISGYEGFYAARASGEALRLAGFHAVGNANNQNYGSEAIMSSNAELDRLGIPHAGTGANRVAARAPVVVERNGVRVGFLQRTSQYWPNNHEAGEGYPGVAALKAYTAYQPPYFKDGQVPPNRPGAPAKIITWVDKDYLEQFRQDIAALKKQSDIVVSSHHMGYGEELLDYQVEIAHNAIDAGADVVMAHAPHYPLGIEIYKGKPIYYGLGSFCFIRSNKKVHRNWVGMLGRVTFENGQATRIAYSMVRQNEAGEVVVSPPDAEKEAVARVQRLSRRLGTTMEAAGDEVVVTVAKVA